MSDKAFALRKITVGNKWLQVKNQYVCTPHLKPGIILGVFHVVQAKDKVIHLQFESVSKHLFYKMCVKARTTTFTNPTSILCFYAKKISHEAILAATTASRV